MSLLWAEVWALDQQAAWVLEQIAQRAAAVVACCLVAWSAAVWI